MSTQGFSIPKIPTLMKVGEDPTDPWNPYAFVVEPGLEQSIPQFGRNSGQKQTGCSSKPLNKPVLLKMGEDPHDPWNICEQLHGCQNLEHQTPQTSSCIRVDPRNAL